MINTEVINILSKRFFLIVLLFFGLSFSFSNESIKTVDSYRIRIDSNTTHYQFDLADYYQHADGLADIYSFDDCYYADIYIFSSMKQIQYHFIINGDSTKGYVEEFTYIAPYDPTDWIMSPIKEFSLKITELNPKNSRDERIVSATLEMLEEL